MADLIELDVVVRNKGLKESISTTERLERQIIKASKALDQNRISQERYNKILLSAKREYEALGLKSQKATAEVRRFAAAQRDLTGSLGTSTKALKQHTEAQMAATKASNRMGVVTQQAGYQVSDFIVQVQSGTNPFVAFSQQASQLAGVLPLVASNIGLTTTAAIALSAALGIAIPLVGAIGAAYLVSRQRAKEASEGTDTFAESLKDAQQASQDLTSELKLLASGFKDVSEAAFAEAISQAEAAVDAAQKRLDNARGIAQKGARGNLKAAEEELRIAQEQLETYRQRRSFLEQESAFYDDIIGSAEGLAAQEEALNEIFEARLGTIDDTANNYEDILGSTEGLAAQEEALNQLYEARLGTIDDTYNNYEDILGSVEGLAAQEQALNDLYESRLGTIDDTFNNYEDILGSAEGLAAQEEALNEIFESRLGTIDDTANNYVDILGTAEGLAAQEEALNQLYESRLGTIDDTYNNYEDILGSAEGLAAQEQALNDLFEARLGTIDDTANNYVDILGSEEGLQKSVDVLNQMYQDRLDKLQATADAYDDILGSEAGLLAAEEARLALTMVGDSGYAGGRGGDPREFSDYFDFVKQITDQEEERNKVTRESTKAVKDNRTAYEKAMMTATEFADALDQQVIGAVDGVADAFSNFLQNGMRDFKSFVGSIKDMFIRLLADMAAMALKRRILIPIAAGFAAGMGSSAAASTVSGMTAGTMGSTLAGYSAAIGTGVSAFGAGFSTTLGMGTTTTGATAMALNPTMASIGAAIPPLIAVAAVFSLFNKKVKELDSGLRVTVDSTGTLVESFRKLETSRLFGLMRSKSTEYEVAGAETADPITEGVSQVQQSILDMANTLGVGSDAFSDFSYQFQVSLKGLSEEQALVKIQEEFTNISDEMAALVPQLSEFAHEGETTTQTLTRLTSDLATVNGAFDRLGRTALEASMDAASAASRLISAAGGQAAFISKTQTLVGAFLDPREQLAYYTKQLQQVSGFEGVPSQEEVKRIFQKGTLEELENLYGGEAISTLQSIFSIQNQLAEEQRRKEEEAARAAAAVDAARQKAEEEAAAAAKAILDERLGLEKQLLELQGNTAELRRLELEAINPANRALQEMIWKLEDAKEAMEGINEVDFKTLFDYQKAVAMARIGQPANIPAPIAMPTQSVVNGTTTNTPSDTNEGSTVQSDAFVRQSLVEIIKYSKRTSDTLRKFDVDGLPPERT